MNDTTVSRRLAQFAVDATWDSLPQSGRHAGRRTFANAVCLAVGASRHPAVERLLSVLQSLETKPEAGLLGRPERIAATWAPLLNGLAMHVEDFDDTHLPTVIHPGAPIVPAALAAGELSGATGEQTLEAMIVGVEVTLRVGNGICPAHFERGWHVTGTTGHLGAAVAAGRLLGLDEDAMVVALGISATQAAGLQENIGTMTKAFHPGKAAADGVEAALLAREGFTGPREPIEGRRGFAEIAAPDPNYQVMTEDLGTNWEIEKNTFKPYACGIVSHPVIDAAIALRDRVDQGERIAEVEVRVNPVVLDVMGVEDPQEGLQSKFSVYHCFAVGFLDGAAGPAQFSDSRARDPEVVALRGRVNASPDPSIAKDEAWVSLKTESGREVEHYVEHATGSVEAPMTDEQLREKVRLVVIPSLGAKAEEFVDCAFRIDELESLDMLFTLARPH